MRNSSRRQEIMTFSAIASNFACLFACSYLLANEAAHAFVGVRSLAPARQLQSKVTPQSPFHRPWGLSSRRRIHQALLPPLYTTSLTGEVTLSTSVVNDKKVTVKPDKDELDKYDSSEQPSDVNAVCAPLKYIGPYPCLALRFPALATSKQRARNVTGVSLDFVLDTAANTNTIQAVVAQELALTVIGSALPGVGSAGIISGGQTYLLGDAQLEGLWELKAKEGNITSQHDSMPAEAKGDELNAKEEKGEEVLDKNNKMEDLIFMTNLTASALPVASPAAAGLLSLAFFQSFPGGVEFVWGTTTTTTTTTPTLSLTTERQQPSITFWGQRSSDSELAAAGKQRVAIQRIPITELPTVTIQINGISMPALLDTGSPVTVLNAKAAEMAGIMTVASTEKQTTAATANNLNPFAALANRFQKAARPDDVLTIFGAGGKRVNLYKSSEPIAVVMPAVAESQEEDATEGSQVDFGAGHVYVGELPGLAALNGLGVTSPPAVVLGMDVLRRRPSMLFRPLLNEVWF